MFWKGFLSFSLIGRFSCFPAVLRLLVFCFIYSGSQMYRRNVALNGAHCVWIMSWLCCAYRQTMFCSTQGLPLCWSQVKETSDAKLLFQILLSQDAGTTFKLSESSSQSFIWSIYHYKFRQITNSISNVGTNSIFCDECPYSCNFDKISLNNERS